MSSDQAMAKAAAVQAATMVWMTIIVMSVVLTMFLIVYTESLWGLVGLLLLGLLACVNKSFSVGK